MDRPPDLALDPAPRARPRPRGRRLALACLAPLAAAASYLLLFLAVPGFADYTRQGLRHLGLPARSVDPGCRELIVNERGRFLWGGPDEGDHFDITTFRLEPGQLHYGLGRERFPALIEPAFVPAGALEAAREEASIGLSLTGRRHAIDLAASARWPGDQARVLVVKVAGDVKVYPLALLRKHEVVNDVVGGRPIFVAYCYLADLAAVYDRRLGGHTLTFAVSGYTYHDPGIWEGRDAFLLWDRETESLWWPPVGRAVSGAMIDAPLPVLDRGRWAQTTWGVVRERYPGALVLRPHQTQTPPADWPRLTRALPAPASAPASDAVAPRWGGNDALGPE